MNEQQELASMEYVYYGIVDRVVDGDTIDVILTVSADVGFGVELRADIQQRLRLRGVDTPEMHGVKHDSDEYRAGVAAKTFVETWVANELRYVEVETFKDKKGKYGRYVADVRNAKGESLADALVEAGHAKRVEY